jgi:hypothetical protein
VIITSLMIFGWPRVKHSLIHDARCKIHDEE